MKLLKIRPLEELVLSKAPIVTHDMFGVHDVSATPLPTTIAGLLGNLLGITYNDDGIGGLERLASKFKEMGCGKPVIIGPLIYFEKLCNEPYVQIGNVLVPSSRIRGVVDVYGREVFYVGIDTNSQIVKFVRGSRVGIKLKRGYKDEIMKVVSRGFIYKYFTSRYITLDEEKSLMPTIVYIINCKVNDMKGIARVGGESRVALIEISDFGEDLGNLGKIVSILQADKGYYVALSPIPILPKPEALNTLLLTNDTAELGFVGEVIGIPPLIKDNVGIEKVKKGDLQPRKRIERLNLGFSETLKKRRPQILSLPPGTIIRIESIEHENVGALLKLLWSIGFASLLKLL